MVNLLGPCHRQNKDNSLVRIWGKAGSKDAKERACTQVQDCGGSEAGGRSAAELEKGGTLSSREKKLSDFSTSVVLKLLGFRASFASIKIIEGLRYFYVSIAINSHHCENFKKLIY